MPARPGGGRVAAGLTSSSTQSSALSSFGRVRDPSGTECSTDKVLDKLLDKLLDKVLDKLLDKVLGVSKASSR